MGDGVGWDTHRDNFPRTRALSQECDVAMAALVEDLRQRGLLDTTLVVWMGEFGRTPQCPGGGRNHWSRAWSSVPELERWRREGMADELTAVETYRSHSIVRHENTEVVERALARLVSTIRVELSA